MPLNYIVMWRPAAVLQCAFRRTFARHYRIQIPNRCRPYYVGAATVGVGMLTLGTIAMPCAAEGASSPLSAPFILDLYDDILTNMNILTDRMLNKLEEEVKVSKDIIMVTQMGNTWVESGEKGDDTGQRPTGA